MVRVFIHKKNEGFYKHDMSDSNSGNSMHSHNKAVGVLDWYIEVNQFWMTLGGANNPKVAMMKKLSQSITETCDGTTQKRHLFPPENYFCTSRLYQRSDDKNLLLISFLFTTFVKIIIKKCLP